jgi:hypothetical protein
MTIEWNSNTYYNVGTVVTYNNLYYRCLNAHKSQVDWTPLAVASLWTQVPTPGSSTTAVTAWKSGMYYASGSMVTYNGNTYQCLNAHSSQVTWTPPAVASLWKEVSPVVTPPVVTPPVVTPPVVTPPVVTPPVVTPPVVTPPVVTPPVVTPPVVTPPVVVRNETTIFAPYLYDWGLDNSSYTINSCMDAYNKVGITGITLAFEVSDGNGGITNISNFYSDFAAFKAVGGKIILSFGGAAGQYAEDALSQNVFVAKVSALIDAIGGVYGLDFDVEGSYSANYALNDKRNKDIVQLQLKYPGIYISYTIPANLGGMTSDGIELISNAISNGVTLNTVNLMTMDIEGLPKGANWGNTAVKISETSLVQLQKLYPNKTKAQVYAMIGITPMIGTNDDQTVFLPSDMIIVAQYAKTNAISLVSFWSVNRDQVGTSDYGVYSQHNDTNFEYSLNVINTIWP